VSYIIACEEYADEADGEFAKAYIGYLASEEGQAEAAESAGAAPISAELSARVATAIETIK
jgi:phosphate transport system substrate-binding protein